MGTNCCWTEEEGREERELKPLDVNSIDIENLINVVKLVDRILSNEPSAVST